MCDVIRMRTTLDIDDDVLLATKELARSQAELRVKNEILEDDLKMAHEIQQAILPQQYPTFPKDVPIEKSLLRFAHRYQPSGEVGGDWLHQIAVDRAGS